MVLRWGRRRATIARAVTPTAVALRPGRPTGRIAHDGSGQHGAGEGRHHHAAVDSARDGDVRARRRHVADERLDLGGDSRPAHDGQRRPVSDRVGGTGVSGFHPDREQGRRPHRPQAGVCARAARIRDRCVGDGVRAEPDRHHHLLGDHRRVGRLAAAARDAVSDPRQLRGRGSDEGVCDGRSGGRDRGRGRTPAGRIADHVSVVARRLPARSRCDRGRPVGGQADPGRALHGRPAHRSDRCGALGVGDGRGRGRDPGVAGGRRIGRGAARGRPLRARRPGLLARATQARGQAGADRPGSVQVGAVPARDLRPDPPADRARRDDDRAAALPADGARIQRAGGGRVARSALAEHVRGGRPRRQEGGQTTAEQHHQSRLRPRLGWRRGRDPARARDRLRLVSRHPTVDRRIWIWASWSLS